MCGISGIFEYRTGHSVDRARLQRMSNTLIHRGPDDEGFLVKPGIGMAVRRLSIIDVAGGHQPLSNEDGSIAVVYNGEIYNYQKLREELLGKGHRLQTRSDTEVIPHLYEDHGLGCVDHLDGMFAFALYDERPHRAGTPADGGHSGRLVLARDRMGKKPLFYADLGDALIFGSEIKAVLQDPRVSKELDLEALHHYLSFLVVPTPRTIFKNIRKLPAGCLLECDASGVLVRRYWTCPDATADWNLPEEDMVAEIRRLLFAGVEKRLVSEVPLGAFLSGGLDSSAVVAIMSRLMRGQVKTFSIGFEGSVDQNELPYARALATYYRTDHHEYLVKPDILEVAQEIVLHTDEPFAVSSAIPTLLLSRAARKDVTVVLTGDGGDEVFGGYEHYLYERWAEAYCRLPAAVDGLLGASASLLMGRVHSPLGRTRSRIERFVRSARGTAGQRRLGWASGFSEEEKLRLFADPIREVIGPASSVEFLDAHVNANLDPAAQVNGLDLLLWLPDEMLAKVDRMTMAASVEARCPLLDRQLVEYALGLRFSRKVPGGRRRNLKHLLRKAVADLIPAELLRRPKHGFNVPLDTWFRGGAVQYLKSVLSPERIGRRGIFDAREVSNLLLRHESGQVNASNRLFALLVFEVWADAYQ